MGGHRNGYAADSAGNGEIISSENILAGRAESSPTFSQSQANSGIARQPPGQVGLFSPDGPGKIGTFSDKPTHWPAAQTSANMTEKVPSSRGCPQFFQFCSVIYSNESTRRLPSADAAFSNWRRLGQCLGSSSLCAEGHEVSRALANSDTGRLPRTMPIRIAACVFASHETIRAHR